MMTQQSALPGDLAMMRLCLSPSQPLCHLLGVSSLKPICPYAQLRDSQTARSSLSLGQSSCPYTQLRNSQAARLTLGPSSSPERSESRSCCVRKDNNKKKRVVFADSRGLSLTAVRLFFPETPAPAGTLSTEPTPARPQAQGPPSSGPRYSLRLAFPQPTLDVKSFYSRLQETRVQLESCSVMERSLMGTVRVCGYSLEKAVHVRVSFDSWKSHTDVPCSYVPQRHGASNTDLFAFDVALPQSLDPKEQVAFCVSYRPRSGAPPLWDDNKGQNYRVCVEHEGSGVDTALASPRRTLTFTRHRPPSWPRCGGTPSLNNHADLNPYSPDMFSYQRWGRLVNPAMF